MKWFITALFAAAAIFAVISGFRRGSRQERIREFGFAALMVVFAICAAIFGPDSG